MATERIRITAEVDVPPEVAAQWITLLDEEREQGIRSRITRNFDLEDGWSYRVDAPYTVERVDD